MDPFTIFINIIAICIGYLIGSINPAYFFGRLKKFDIREEGDGIAGTVTSYHVLGIKYAIPTGTFDFFKGILVIFIALLLGADFVIAQISGLAAIVGHVFPFYIKFRGGQGMACASGILLAYLLNYLLTGPEMLIFIFTYLIFVIIIFFYSNTAASVSTYPIEGWQISTPEEQGIRSQTLAEMMGHIKRNNFSIDSILIVRNGYLVLDAYFYPFIKGQKHIIYSTQKASCRH